MGRLRTIEEEIQSNPDLKVEDINALREWANEQPHLPRIDDIPDMYLALFLRRRYYDLEKAKQTLDNFLTFRTHVPEMSINRSISRTEVQNYFDTHYCIPLKQRDPDGNLICFVSLHDPDPSKYDVEAAYKTGGAIFEAWFLENGSYPGKTFVYDQKMTTIGHLKRMSVSAIKNLAYYNKDCDPSSIKTFYIINANSFMQKIYTLLYPLIRRAAFQRIKIFSPAQMDEFYKLVPKEWLPNEYGGRAGTLQELNRKSQELIQRHEDFFEKLDTLKVDESKRPPQRKNKYFYFW